MGAVVTSIGGWKDWKVGRGVVKVIGLGYTTAGRLRSVFVIAVNNGGRLDAFTRATGLATSLGLLTSTATTSCLLCTNWLGWVDLIATHLICPLLALINPLHFCLLTIRLAFVAGFRNIVTAVAPRMVGDTVCRALEHLGPLWPHCNTLRWIFQVAIKRHEHGGNAETAG